jgi:hypothetical protein
MQTELQIGRLRGPLNVGAFHWESVRTNHEAKKVSAHPISWLQRWAGEGVGGDLRDLM